MRWLETRIPPPVVAAIMAGAMWGIDAAVPGLARDFPGRDTLIVVALALGVVSAAAGVLEFRRARTTIDPLHPEKATAIVDSGIYGFTRNPMYLGLLLILLAWALYLANGVAVVGPVLFVGYMNRFQIGPEERALARVFGARYDTYRSRVRRWI